MNPSDKQCVLEFIRESQHNLPLPNLPIHDYQSLKPYVLEQELLTEIQELMGSLDRNDFPDVFKERCKTRASVNANSCLSLFATPESPSNQLYLKIASQLFQPKSLHEMLGILLPEIETCIVPTMEIDKDQKLNSMAVRFKFEAMGVTNLTQAFSLDELKHYVCFGKQLFDVRDIANLNFDLHLSLHDRLTSEYPDLAKQLYQHNSGLRNLLQHIQMLHGTPMRVIQSLIHELRLGGEKMTSLSEASNTAKVAWTEFLSYLELLPPETKTTLMSLRAEKSIEDVVIFLRRGNCVEEAACYLEQIIHKSNHQPFLKTHPHISDSEVRDIKRQYQANHPLLTQSENYSVNFPSQHLHAVFSKISIDSVHDFVYLLIVLPTALYDRFFQRINIQWDASVLYQLSLLLKQGFLNSEQQSALFSALIRRQAQSGKLETLVDFALLSRHVEWIPIVLEKIPQERRVDILKKRRRKKESIFHQMLDLDILCKTLLLCPENERFALLNEKDAFGNNVVYFWISHANAIPQITQLLPKDNQLMLLQESCNGGFTMLHEVLQHPQGFENVWQMYAEFSQLEAAKKKTIRGDTALHMSVRQSHHLQAILRAFPTDEARRAAILEENYAGESVLYLAAEYPESLQLLIALFSSQDELITALLVKTKRGKTAAQQAAKNPKAKQILLNAISEDKLFLLNPEREDERILPEPNYSFYFKCLKAVAVLSGLATLCIGLALSQLIVIAIGAATLLSGVTLMGYGFFSHKSAPDKVQDLRPHLNYV